MAGLEVEEMRYVGLPLPESSAGSHPRLETRLTGLAWAAQEIVVAAVLEVMPHPNADRLVLCRLVDGTLEHIVLTGAPNLYPYKGLGELEKPLKVPYAKEGAQSMTGTNLARCSPPQARQNSRGRILFDDLLRERAGHLRRARGRDHPG